MADDAEGFPSLPSSHPYASALEQASVEFAMGCRALAQGNQGRARVCGRRMVGAFLQEAAPLIGGDVGVHAMANLRFVRDHDGLPFDIRNAADRLLGGARRIAAKEPYSTDPLNDAVRIISHFIRKG